MLFQEALELLKQRQFLCRAAWSLEDGYLAFLPGMKHVWKIVLCPNPNAGNYIFSYEDLLAEDWQNFQLPEENENQDGNCGKEAELEL